MVTMEESLQLGTDLFTGGNFKQAIEHFTKCLNSNGTKDPVVLHKRSVCLYKTEQYELALQDAQTLMTVVPNSPVGNYLCGKALAKLHRFEDALAAYRKGLEKNPKDQMITNGLKALQNDIIVSFENKSDSTYNAVTMSSMEQYPGDEELEVLETEILAKWGVTQFPTLNMQIPDQKRALQEFQAALQFKKAGNDNQTFESLQAALEHDPANFTMWGEAAGLLYEMGDYRKAYQYCRVVPPELRSAKYWKLGGNILNSMVIPVHAENWLRQASKLDKDDTDAQLLFQNVRVKRIYGPLTLGSKVEVNFTRFGRAVMATEDIQAGEECFRDKAVVLAQTIDSLGVAACVHCAKCLMRPEGYFGADLISKTPELKKIVQKHWPIRDRIPCLKCDKAVYCSVKCRDENWDTSHQVLCVAVYPQVDRLYKVCEQYRDLSSADTRVWNGVWNASFSPFILANIWAGIICLANTIAKQNARECPNASDWTMAKSPYRKFIAYGSSSNASVIPEMVNIMRDVFAGLPDGWSYAISQREFDGRYFQATCNVQAFSDDKPPFNEFMKNIANEPCRDMVHLFTTKDPDDALFAGMFPLHACLNHSCDNNVEVLDGAGGVIVRAKRPIKTGEEMFTTYINTRMPRKERRAWLYRGYNFWCQCDRCQFEGDGPEKCTECDKKAKDEKKERFPGCGKCHRAWYCSTSCQKAAWKKGHKKICRPEED